MGRKHPTTAECARRGHDWRIRRGKVNVRAVCKRCGKSRGIAAKGECAA